MPLHEKILLAAWWALLFQSLGTTVLWALNFPA